MPFLQGIHKNGINNPTNNITVSTALLKLGKFNLLFFSGETFSCTANEIISLGYDPTEDVEDIMDNAEKKIFNIMRYVHLKDDRGYYYCEAVGIAYRNSYSETSFTLIGKKNIYRFWIRYAPTNTEKGSWKLKFMKWHNDHVGCM